MYKDHGSFNRLVFDINPMTEVIQIAVRLNHRALIVFQLQTGVQNCPGGNFDRLSFM